MNRYAILPALFALLASPAVAENSFRAGAATSNITPEIGAEIIGGFVPFPSTNIHDELRARCLVLDDGKTKLALVVCDLLGIDRVISEIAREQISQRHGIPPANVLISATHTHSAASALGEDSRVINQTGDSYQRFVAQRISDGVTRAIHNLRAAEIGFGAAEAPEHVFNRRWHMVPGTIPTNPFGESDMVKMNPPRGTANLLEPAGPTDPTISFIAVRDLDGAPIALYAAYSLHYVGGVRKGDVSADYFAVFCERLQDLVARDHADSANQKSFVAMIANGTSGDINNINFRKKSARKPPYEQMRWVGTDVAEKVYGALSGVSYRNDISLAAAYREPVVGWRQVSPERKEWAEQTIAAGPKTERDLSYIYAQRTLRQAAYPATTTVPLQVLRIGEIGIGTMPFEVFAEIGLEFKSQCPIPSAFMVELAHGYYGYLPTPRHHKLGGYETWLGTNRVEPNASRTLLNTLLEMSSQLAPADH